MAEQWAFVPHALITFEACIPTVRSGRPVGSPVKYWCFQKGSRSTWNSQRRWVEDYI